MCLMGAEHRHPTPTVRLFLRSASSFFSFPGIHPTKKSNAVLALFILFEFGDVVIAITG